jgi:hypothetical protein
LKFRSETQGGVNYFLAKNRQMATQFSENGIFCRKFPVFGKKIRQKATENWFFGGWCRHIYAYLLQFSEFLEINSPVSRNLPRDARHRGYIRKLKKKTLPRFCMSIKGRKICTVSFSRNQRYVRTWSSANA